DLATAIESNPVTIDVLANDTAPASPLDPTTVTVTIAPLHGTVSVNAANGMVTYIAASGFLGTDYFFYTVRTTTGEESCPTQVTITVIPVNHPPVANNDSYATNEDTTLTVAAPGVLANDSDADGDPLTAVLVSGPSHGTLTLASDGSFSYMPAA